MKYSALRGSTQYRTVGKGSISSLDHDVDLEHCVFGNHKVKIDVAYCVQTPLI